MLRDSLRPDYCHVLCLLVFALCLEILLFAIRLVLWRDNLAHMHTPL